MVLSGSRLALRWSVLILLFIGAVIFAASWGAPVPLADIWSSDPQTAQIARRIFWWVDGEPGIRPTRVLAGVLVGASLAVAGATLQSIFKNPLAEPYLLGISAGGALGATLSKALPWIQDRFDATSIFAFIGAMLSALSIYVLGRGKSTLAFDRSRLLLTGVALSAFLAACMSLTIALSGQADLARQITFWLLGGLGEAMPRHNIVLLVCLLPGIAILLASSRDLNASRLGDEDAASLGIQLGKLHARLLLVASLLSAAAVAAAGLIGFIGLLGPHLVRMVFGSDARRLVPASALAGATLLVLCDALARSALPPQELPVGVVTALLGVPLFLFIARKYL